MMKKLKGWLRRLLYLHGNVQVNPLMYIFVYFSFITGLGFLSLALQDSDKGLTMFQIMHEQAGHGGTILWASLSILSAIGVIVSMICRKRMIAEPTAFLGFGLWFYMGWLYGLEGFWDGVLIAAIPNMCFWIWFSLRIEWYRRVIVPLQLRI